MLQSAYSLLRSRHIAHEGSSNQQKLYPETQNQHLSRKCLLKVPLSPYRYSGRIYLYTEPSASRFHPPPHPCGHIHPDALTLVFPEYNPPYLPYQTFNFLYGLCRQSMKVSLWITLFDSGKLRVTCDLLLYNLCVLATGRTDTDTDTAVCSALCDVLQKHQEQPTALGSVWRAGGRHVEFRGRTQRHTSCWWGKHEGERERDPLQDLEVDGRLLK
jgi:hypothetical protein